MQYLDASEFHSATRSKSGSFVPHPSWNTINRLNRAISRNNNSIDAFNGQFNGTHPKLISFS
jgi:hypothetical protein